MPLIPAAEWLPDQADYQNQGSPNVANVYPDLGGYRPFPAFTVQSDALGARARGLWFGRAVNGSARVFCGTETKLYALEGNSWNDVSRASGGAYACPRFWSFVQFGDSLLAFNGVDAPQVFTLSDVIDGSIKFVALGGSPPLAEFVTVVRDFAFTGKIDSALNRNQWSGINNSASWATSATTMADQQDIPSGGNVRGIAGGEYAVVFQDDAIQRYTFVGPPTIFQRDEIATNVGASIQGSVAQHGRRAFGCHRTGFYMVVDGSQLVPIGAQKVDRTFWATIDQNYLDRVSSAIDPGNKCYLISFPNGSSASGTPNEIWAYNWEAERWAPIAGIGDHEMIGTASAMTAVGIDDDDGFADDIDAAGAPPLDSEIYFGTLKPLIAAFNTSHKLTFSNGAAMAATIDTTEQQIAPGQRVFVRAARPIVASEAEPDFMLALGVRDSTGEAVMYTGAASPQSADGLCKFRVKGRYVRGRIVVPAGETWDYVQGIDEVIAVPAGTR